MLFFEIAKLPRGSRVLYDRRHSAVSRMHPGDLPVDVFQPDGAQAFHTTGITLALSPELTNTAHHALQLAKSAGWLMSLTRITAAHCGRQQKRGRDAKPMPRQRTCSSSRAGMPARFTISIPQ